MVVTTMGVAAPGHLLLLFSGQLSPQVNVTAPEFFPIFREEDSISIRKVPIYDRYSNILEGADNGKLYVIKSIFSIDCGGLGTLFLSHHFLRVKRFLI